MSDNMPNPEESSIPKPEEVLGAEPAQTPEVSDTPPASSPVEIPAMSPPPMSPPPMSPPPGYSTPPQSEFASNYPRANPFMSGYIRPPGVYWDTIGLSVNMIFANWVVYAVCTIMVFAAVAASYVPLMFLLFGSFMSNMNNPTMTASPIIILPAMVVQFVYGFLVVCVASVGVRQAQGNYPQLTDFFIPFTRLPKSLPAVAIALAPLFAVSIVVGLVEIPLGKSFVAIMTVSAFSAICQLVYYVCFHGPLMLSAVAAVFTEDKPVDCVKRTFATLGIGNALIFGVLFLLGNLLSGLGFLLCLVGGLFSHSIAPNILALHYIYCFPAQKTPAEPEAPAYA